MQAKPGAKGTQVAAGAKPGAQGQKGAPGAKPAEAAPVEVKKKKEKKGKKTPKDTTPSQKWKAYEVNDGKLVRKNKTCPKCGKGVFLSIHKDRMSCGKCGYSEKIPAENKK
ncbi:MAG: 30S ribosomal protein S27ae [Euryarchaeota archaeon HGW-Euryarchaeota-1]|nr:MAG: 30S ribosomal protein S27ae [Euryarchaeota archaeon HGW-Euryarchaeota-1]